MQRIDGSSQFYKRLRAGCTDPGERGDGDGFDAVFSPLLPRDPDQSVVIGQIGQSLDGRIATATGESKYINGPEGMAHLHRLRAICDGVIIGVGTALADDPLLTVRHVEGKDPARIVIDPSGRVPGVAKVFNQDGARRVLVTLADTQPNVPNDVEIVRIAPNGGNETGLNPADIVASLADLGLNRLLIEGGAHTVSRFLAAGSLTRLHVIVAPIILGGGKPGFAVAGIDQLDQAIRPDVQVYQVGNDILFDCDVGGGEAGLAAQSDIAP